MASDDGSVASKSSASNYRRELAANVVMNGGKLTNRMLSKDDRAWRCEALFKYASTLPGARKNKLVKAVEVEQRRTADLETAEEPMPQLPASAPAPAPTPVPATTDAQPTLADRNLGGISLPLEPQKKKKQKVALSSPEQAFKGLYIPSGFQRLSRSYKDRLVFNKPSKPSKSMSQELCMFSGSLQAL